MAGHFGGNPYKWEGGGANSPHITRYFLAKGWIMPGEIVLDAACGTGYGSHLFAQVAKKVIGYEVDPGCIESANHDKPKNCEFEVMDLNSCELPDVDIAVTIETVEHVDNFQHFVKQLKKHTKRCIVVCAPIGGTSFAYKDEPPGPATEKNDFMKIDDLIKLFVDKTWKEFNSFQYGYSGFVILYKESPKEPKHA